MEPERELAQVHAHPLGGGRPAARQAVDQLLPAAPAREELAAFEEAKQQAALGFSRGWVGAALLANTLLGGSGMLGVPHAFSVVGYFLGVVLIGLFGCVSSFGCHLLQCTARRLGKAPCSFYTVASEVAPRWTWLIDGAVGVKCFGVATSYLIIIGDLLPDAMLYFGAEGLLRQRWVSVTGAFLVAGSLACFPKLSALRYTSIAAICIVAWTVILVAMHFAGTFDPCREFAAGLLVEPLGHANLTMSAPARRAEGVTELPCSAASFVAVGDDPLKIIKALPVFIFSFTCHQNVFTVCNEVRNTSRERVDIMIAVAYVLSATAFTATAFMGYKMYGGAVKSDVLKNFPQTGIVEATRMLYALLVICSYPLLFHPARLSCLALWRMVAPPRAEAEDVRYWWATAVLLACSYGVAISMTDLGVMLAIVGATGSTMVSYILPGIMYRKTFRTRHCKRHLALAQLCMGCVIMPMCLITLLL